MKVTEYYEDLDRTKTLGREYAENGIAGGQLSPEESPLSGEWSGSITVNDILRQLGADPDKVQDFERDDVSDNWEDGYYSADWAIPTGAEL